MAGDIRIGVSGWRYAPWRGNFYPKGLTQANELAHASRQFPSIEINGSFYSLQRPESWRRWAEAVPRGFCFAVKGPRYITHTLRLRDTRVALANFFASGLLALGDKLGPLLWQLPPSLPFNGPQLEEFLSMLPRDTEAAAALAQQRAPRMQGREVLEAAVAQPLRHALEVRHPSFVDPAFIALLRRQDVAFVVADTAGRFPEFEDVTSDMVYLRLHGATRLYQSRYTPEQLDAWARRIRAWSEGGQPRTGRRISPEPPPRRTAREVYCFFDNTDKKQAPRNARSLLKTFGIEMIDPA